MFFDGSLNATFNDTQALIAGDADGIDPVEFFRLHGWILWGAWGIFGFL